MQVLRQPLGGGLAQVRAAAVSRSRPYRLRALAAWCLALLLPLLGVLSARAEPLLIDAGTLHTLGGEPAADGAPTAQDVQLPLRLYRAQRVYTRYRFETRFDAAAPLRAGRPMLQLDSWPDGGRIVLNGFELASVPTSGPDQVVRHLRPFAFVVPPGLLREQGNMLAIEWGSRETLVLLPRLQLGLRAEIESRYERQLFWEHTVAQGSVVFAAVVAVVTLGVWWPQRRREAPREYLLIGIGAVGWMVFNGVLFWSPVAASWFLFRRALGIAAVGLFVATMWVCLVRLAPARLPRFEQLALGWSGVGPVLMLAGYLVTGATHLPVIEAVWTVGAAGMGLVPLAVLLRTVRRSRSLRTLSLMAFVLVAVALAARESLLYVLRDPIGSVHLGLQVLAPLWLATACGVLVQDFVRSLRAAEQQRADLDRRLAEREAELARLHERDRDLATLEERRRIMQDMHDGLGSQLVSSLVLAERGQLAPAQTAELLRGCIDDLRLAIDTLGDGAVDLAVAAGNLRFRMEPRLRAAGLRLRWDLSGLPDDLALPGAVALPVLRVLQEALTNALKHAGAQTLQVKLSAANGTLQLQVQDDGQGFDATAPAAGKGLSGMHKRARGLGAELHVGPCEGGAGSCVRLSVPLG